MIAAMGIVTAVAAVTHGGLQLCLLSSKTLLYKPKRCLIVEDSIGGLEPRPQFWCLELLRFTLENNLTDFKPIPPSVLGV